MKRSLRMVGLAALLVVPGVVSAQESTRPVSFGVSGGASLPMGDLADGFSTGFNVSGHLYFKPAAFTNLGFRADVSFDRFGAKGLDDEDTGDFNYRFLGVTGNALYNFPQSSPGMVRPYVLGGVGFYNAKTSVTVGGVGSSSASSTDLGVQAGAGVNFQLSGFSTFVEAKFVNVFGDGSSANFVPITFGIRF
jgi:hypothetical protein